MEKEKRLIDADALENRMRANAKVEANDTQYDIGRVHGLINAADLIHDAPTVDAVEVVHGRMFEVTPDAECPWHKVWECSLCGNRGDVWYNYCPNCGAKMRGDSE